MYEERAAEYLIQQGYEIIEKNYRCRIGEIDLIGIQQGWLCFIEVKYRKDSKAGDPLEAVGLQKQKKIIQTAQFYLLTHPQYRNAKCRFDAVGILPGSIRLVQNAFLC